MASSSSSPCAACKFLRRKCTAECVFSPYFPPDQPQKFANVHKIFGASNISKLLHELSPHQREDAVNSLAYEADARVKDPVYGCVGAISILQRQVAQLQQELSMAHQDLARYAGSSIAATPSLTQQTIPSPLRIGTGLHQAAPGISREQIFARDHLMGVTREQQLSREQLLEIARIGGGSYEAGLAALGLSVSFGPLGPPPPSRQGSNSSGGGGSGMRHLSP
ncbi:hypothetical protein O6H91_10G072400 [Diphasiastrum complanatum]|uniref:Uncharacterized protein n=1 Tax=Diphasiastrum complanatum TaxID=34168 RepID=A0ACC2CI72_DIPCM|nr:hypothetical protein O6H91_10G072400 [Diphasiastrum complanatum]